MARTDSKWNTILGGTAITTISPTGYDILINGSNKYLNFNSLVGISGYGFRDNGGIMEFKNNGGSWTAFGSGGSTVTFGGQYEVPFVNATNDNFDYASIVTFSQFLYNANLEYLYLLSGNTGDKGALFLEIYDKQRVQTWRNAYLDFEVGYFMSDLSTFQTGITAPIGSIGTDNIHFYIKYSENDRDWGRALFVESSGIIRNPSFYSSSVSELYFSTATTGFNITDPQIEMNFLGIQTYIYTVTGLNLLNDSKINLANSSTTDSTIEGSLWYSSTKKTLSARLDGMTQRMVGAMFKQTADKTVTNTTTETSIIGTGSGSTSLPANFWTVDKTLRLRVGGVYSTPSLATPSLIIKVKYGSTILAQVTTSGLLSGASNLEFDGEVTITCRTVGTTGTVAIHGDIEYATGVAGTIAVDSLNNGGATATINTTAANTVDITVQWDTATTTRIAKSTITILEML